MITNDPYIAALGGLSGWLGLTARLVSRLHLDGEWDGALALLDEGGGDSKGGHTAATRARILVERNWWRLDDPAPAARAVAGLDDPLLRGFLAAQLAYTRILFALDPQPHDQQVMQAGLQQAAQDQTWRAWATFWQGAVADNIHDDPDTARQRYDDALALSRDGGDLLLESYIIRHQGDHLIKSDRAAGEMLLRRSLYLRSALGARPQTAAAQAMLADELPPGQERDTLVQAARSVASELGLTWLNKQLAETSQRVADTTGAPG
jgi:hypothetical protein